MTVEQVIIGMGGYSTLKNNACISMDFVLHSLNAGNSIPPYLSSIKQRSPQCSCK
jgi:hypothetical protein